MKLLLTLLFALPFTLGFSQDMQLNISAGKETISVSLDDDNSGKLVNLSQHSAANNFLTIKILNEEIDKDWKRSFTIYNAQDSAIKDFMQMKNGSYCIKLKDLLPALHQSEEYFIYTIAFPKDPKKAMLVRPARKLVCEIKLND